MRRHSLAIALLMSVNAGAEILPTRKPGLLPDDPKITEEPTRPIYYTAEELRVGIQAFEPNSVAKTSRILGVIVSGKQCFCLYHTGHTRMYWMRNQEENTVASIETLLSSRGFHCTVFNQVIIGSNLNVAVRIARYKLNGRSRYFTLSDEYNHCYFLVNNSTGDELLGILINPERRQAFDKSVLKEYSPPPEWTRYCEAITLDGKRPVILGYPFDLLRLYDLDGSHTGFKESPILLCFDYQREALQTITGPLVEVRPFQGGFADERETQ